jgi:hypothetical protein
VKILLHKETYPFIFSSLQFMTVPENREAFIPYRRSDIIKLCLNDGRLNAAETKKFKDFCEILSSY